MKLTTMLLFTVAAQAGVTRNQARGNLLASYELVDVVLEECVANDNGVLVWQKDGNFGESCNYCKVMINGEGEAPGYFLQCRCKTKSGGATNQDFWSFNLGRWHIS
ncbi:hypothetical protein VUR80DRAFT_184 [Thermomyces stellatus]